jgi:formylglycine-generating enzyme required for sulfatase activity
MNQLGLADVRGNVSEWILDRRKNRNPEYTRGAFNSRYLALDPPYFFLNQSGAKGSPNVGFRVVLMPE